MIHNQIIEMSAWRQYRKQARKRGQSTPGPPRSRHDPSATPFG